MNIFGVLLCCTVAFATDVSITAGPLIQSSSGSYQGSVIKSELGKDIYSFTGIRYAEAPTGLHRFKEASPVKSHNGVFDATKTGPVCTLPYHGHGEISEDCLRLSVYIPAKNQTGDQSDQTSQQSKKPVLVFLHPGAYFAPFGSSYGLGPQYASDQDIVLVTINYRVGALGFLSVGDERAPGNAGLKDQVLALKWVQQNIAAFGGNPNSVTLAGHNIGAASVTLHIASPASAGLFHKAIIMSGAAPTYYALPNNRKDLAKKQAELLGCPSDLSGGMFNCLAGKSVQDFADSYHQLSSYNGHPVAFLPVVEQAPANAVEQPFLSAQPVELISQGKANFVPLFSGVTRDEFLYLSMRAESLAQKGDSRLYDELNNNWETIAPKRFDYESGTPKSSIISRAFRSYYFNDQPLKVGSYYALGNLYSDALTYYPVYKFEKYFSAYTSAPIYNYLYSYANSHPFKSWSNGTSAGITHYDQLTLLFKVPGYPAHSQKDLQCAQQIWEFIANFAEYGNPMPENKAQRYPVKWQPSTASQPQYFEYTGEHAMMVQGYPHQQNMYKWDEILQ